MPTSVFVPEQNASIEYSASGNADSSYVGLQYLGGTKQYWRRSLFDWNLFGAPLSGRALTPSDVLLSAELIIEVIGVSGPTGWNAYIERITRDDWQKASATWANYKTASAWTTAGGDVDTATPPRVAFASPAVLGDYEIAGLLGFAEDAIANRSGVVRALMRKDDETVTTTHTFTPWWNLSDNARRARLRVAYADITPRPMMEQRSNPSPHAARPARPAAGSRPTRPATV